MQKLAKRLFRPWVGCIAAAAAVPLMPEYIAPILALAAFSFACLDAYKRGSHLRIGWLGTLIAVYVGYMLIGVLYSSHPFNTLSSVAMWVVMGLLYLSLHTVLCSHRRVMRAVQAITLGAGIAGGIALVQYALNMALHIEVTTMFWERIDNVFYQTFPLELNFVVPGQLRASGPFNNPNILAEYLVMALPFAHRCAFGGKRTRFSPVARVCLFLGIGGIAVSFCRGAYLAVLTMATILFVFGNERRTGMVLTVLTALAVVPMSVVSRFMSIGSGDRSITHRLEMWEIGLQRAADHPIFGYGAGVSNTGDMLAAGGVNAPHMHNTFIQAMIEGGLVSFTMVLMMVYFILWQSMNMLILQRNRKMAVAFIAFTVGICTTGMFDFLFMTPKLVGVFLTVAALVDTTGRLDLPMGKLADRVFGMIRPGRSLRTAFVARN